MFEFKLYQIGLDMIGSRLDVENPIGTEKRKLINLLNNFMSYENPKSLGKNIVKQEAEDQTLNDNRLPQRRIYITPSLKIIAPMQVEQSNPILRELKYVIEYMARINLMNDSFEDEFFNSDKFNELIDTFVKPSIHGIKFCGVDLKFLNYSASQIKQKSWWDYVDNHKFNEIEQGEPWGDQINTSGSKGSN